MGNYCSCLLAESRQTKAFARNKYFEIYDNSAKLSYKLLLDYIKELNKKIGNVYLERLLEDLNLRCFNSTYCRQLPG